MLTRPRLALGALVAALTLGLAVGSASASRLSTSVQSWRQVWTPLTISTAASGGGMAIRCNVTFEGSFHTSTIVKTLNSLIGYVTLARAAHPCAGIAEAWPLNGMEAPAGLGTIEQTLPWHITYEGFEGSLPSITGVILLIRPKFTIKNATTGLCLYEGNVRFSLKLAAGIGTGIVPDGTIAQTKSSGGFFCPERIFYSVEAGAGNAFTQVGSANTISIRLI